MMRKNKYIMVHEQKGGVCMKKNIVLPTLDLKSAEVRISASGGTRTPDHLVRSQVLYPTELRTRMQYYELKIASPQ